MSDTLNLEDSIEPQLKQDIELVKQELKHLSDGKEYGTFDTIEEEVVNLLCKENDLNPSKQFRDAMTTPFAIARYIELKAQDENMCKEVEEDLNSFLDKEEATWTIHKDLSNEVTFSKPLQEDTILQRLVVRYRKDPLTNKIIYSLHGNWDISKQNLKALVECRALTSDYTSINLNPLVKVVSNEEIVFEIGNAFTISCKKI